MNYKKLIFILCTSIFLSAERNASAQTVTANPITNVSCNGSSNGSAFAIPSGGTSPYTYAWAPSGGTADTASGLAAGNYTVTLTDNIGNTASATVSITQPLSLVFANTSSFSFAQAVQTWTVPAGVNNVTITAIGGGGGNNDGNGWPSVGGNGAQITGISSVTSGDVINIITGGAGTGPSGSSIGGGGGGGSYVWDASSTTLLVVAGGGGGAGLDFNRLARGGNGQTDTSSLTTPTTDSYNLCAPGGTGGNGGSAYNTSLYAGAAGAGWNSNGDSAVSTGGGTAYGGFDPANGAAGGSGGSFYPGPGGYGGGGGGEAGGGGGGGYNGGGGGGTNSYPIPGGGGGGSFCSGTVLTTSAINTGNGSVAITYTIAPITVNQNVSCFGGNNGSFTASNIEGGTSPYNYSWTGGETTGTATGLSAGTYTLTVTDFNGCSLTASAVISQPVALSASASEIANVSCNGGSNGKVSSSVSGGTSPYTYLWTGGSTTDTATGLSAGSYTLNVTDSNGCSTSSMVAITQPNALSATASTVTNVNCNGSSTGSATTSISGGTSPYTYLWAGGETSDTATGLSAGTYSVTVSDSCGASVSGTVTITQPTALSSATATIISNVGCNGSNNGSASVSITGGGLPYTYLWTNGSTTNTATGLTAGTYSVTVSDLCGASASTTVIITQPNALTSAVSVVTNVSCNGGTNGSAAANISGGTLPFTYSWAGGETTDTATGLSAGTYTLTVADLNGCTLTASAVISQPLALTASASIIANVSCNGNSTGSASVSISGGTSPFTYLWTNSSTSNIATGLSAGTYSVTVSDSCGGSASGTVTITQPAALSSATVTIISNVNCNGGNTGSASVSISGGGSPYTYSWTNGSTTNTATGLTAGTYSVTVSDLCGASASAMVSITQPSTLAVTTDTTSNVSCHGGNNGGATSTVTGGTSPYTYLWTGGQNNASAIGLTAGNYTVMVTDNNGCSATASVSITQPIALSVSLNATANVLCNGGNNGSASSIVGGGVYPYTYSWTNGSTKDTATGLSAGTYTLNVTDEHGCTTSATVNITQPATAMTASANILTNVNCYGGNDGSAKSNVVGGASPYTYSWSDGQTNAIANGLTAGAYTVTVTDKNGCSATAMANIIQPATPVTLNPDVITNVSCNGGNNGAAITSASGGFIPYTYSWTNGSTTNTATGLTAGAYIVTVTDNHGCSASMTVSIVQPAASVTVSASMLTGVSCYGENNGSALATASGGVSSYSYLWSNGETTANANSLIAGTFTVTATDSNGCSATTTVIITQPAPVAASINVITDVLCNGGNTGSVSSGVTGGTSPYTYAWSDGKTSANVNGLSAGTYNLNVTDGNGCSTSAVVTITQPTAVTAVEHTLPDNGSNTGSAWVRASGGVGPYSYLWSPGGNTRDTITGQAKGKYCCTITDANGCTFDICDSIMSDLGIGTIVSNEGQVSVYPNPNNGEFTIQYSVAGQNTLVEIYNVLGAEIFTKTFVSDKSGNTISITNQPAGIYLYRVISTENGSLLGQGKIVLQK